MILSHRHRFIFFCNGKTGTSSIEHSLAHLNEGQDYAFHAPGLFVAKHLPPAILKGCLPQEMWSSYYKFVFVRNPYDWIASQWNYNFLLRYQGLADSHPDKRALNPATAGAGPIPVLMGRGLAKLAATTVFSSQDIDFLFAFLRKNHRGLPHADGCYQSSYVFDADGKPLVDFVGRFERLQQDYAVVLEKLGLELELPHLKRAGARDYRSYFTPQSAARAAQLWAGDFAAFGYATNLNA